jgi:hypothetical protein
VKPANFSTLLDDIRDACLMLMQAAVKAAKRIGALPWPALLACAFFFAIAMTIVPLALCLFIVFMVIKFAVAAIVVDKQRSRRS